MKLPFKALFRFATPLDKCLSEFQQPLANCCCCSSADVSACLVAAVFVGTIGAIAGGAALPCFALIFGEALLCSTLRVSICLLRRLVALQVKCSTRSIRTRPIR